VPWLVTLTASSLAVADPILCRNAAHDVFPFQINRSGCESFPVRLQCIATCLLRIAQVPLPSVHRNPETTWQPAELRTPESRASGAPQRSDPADQLNLLGIKVENRRVDPPQMQNTPDDVTEPAESRQNHWVTLLIYLVGFPYR